MPKTSKWGSESLKAGNTEVHKAMFDMLLKLGTNPKGKSGKDLSADEFHAASPKWQQFTATSFRSAFNRVKKLVGKSVISLSFSDSYS